MLARRLKAAAFEKAPLAAGDDRSRQVEGVDVEEHKRLCPRTDDLKWADQFPYVPAYQFYPYRSIIGATGSILLAFIFFLRMVSSTMDFIDLPPLVTESRDRFPRDSTDTYDLPRVGVQFRQNGWKPFNDPRYMEIAFDQGVIHKSGNISCALRRRAPPPSRAACTLPTAPLPHAHTRFALGELLSSPLPPLVAVPRDTSLTRPHDSTRQVQLARGQGVCFRRQGWQADRRRRPLPAHRRVHAGRLPGRHLLLRARPARPVQ